MDEIPIKDVITTAVNRTLIPIESCCNTPGKFCDSDVWKGNLEIFIKEFLKVLLPQLKLERYE